MSPGRDRELAERVERAREGDRPALEALLRAVRDDVYNLAVRMLWHPEDAEDATQEILIRLMTGLDSFRGESSFRTWAWRVAANHLLTTRKRRAERPEWTFESFAEDLANGLTAGERPSGRTPAEHATLVEEVKIGCSQGMLLCLDRGHRLAYILGEIVGLDHKEASEVLEITPAAFRKRLSRARSRLHAFLRRRCGLVNDEAACRCRRRVERALETGRVRRDGSRFARHPRADPEAVRHWRAVESVRDEASVLVGNPLYAAPDGAVPALRELLDERLP